MRYLQSRKWKNPRTAASIHQIRQETTQTAEVIAQFSVVFQTSLNQLQQLQNLQPDTRKTEKER